MLKYLCTQQMNNCIADIIAVLFIFIMTCIGAKKGFINCFFGLVSTLLSLVVAVSFTKVFISMTDGLFGLESFLQTKLEGAFATINGFNADVSESGVEVALQEQNLPAILARLVMKVVGKQDTIAPGTTLAMLLGETTSGMAITLIAGFVLFIVTRIAVRLLKSILSGIAEKITLIHGVNIMMGACVGFMGAALILSAILAVMAVFPNEKIVGYLAKTIFLGALYANNPLVVLIGALL